MTYRARSPRWAADGKPIYPRDAAPLGLVTEQQLRARGKRPGAPPRGYVEVGEREAVALYSAKSAVSAEPSCPATAPAG